MDKPLKESLKTGARVVVLAIIPVLSVALQDWNFDWRIILVTGGTAFLSFVDSLLHETAKEEPKVTRNEGMLGEKGLTGF